MQSRKAIANRRRERTRALLEQQGWQALVAYGNAWRAEYLRYVSDFGILEGHGVAVVEPKRTTLFLESPYEAERAEVETDGVAVRLVPDVFAAAAGAVAGANGALAFAPAAFSPLALARALPEAADATAALADLLMHKADEEVDAIARAAAMADEGYAVFRAAVRPGRREYEVIGEVEAFLRSRGCPEQFVIMAAGNTDVRGMRPPSDRRIVAGDVVITEITPAIDGYFAQLCRTLVVGEPNAAQRAAFDLFARATEAGIALVRPGVTAAEIAKAENDVFRAAGLGEYTTSQYTRVRGHGMGLNLDGGPSILEDVTTPLAPGMTLIVHPNTYHPEVGYMVLGDALAVTADGHRRLASTPLELFSVPA
jgi:Xaa-Pro aminopeptidase